MSDLVKILPGENKYLSVTWQVNNFCNYRAGLTSKQLMQQTKCTWQSIVKKTLQD